MKYIVFIDSDGTLRNDDGLITKKTKKVIKKLREKEIGVVIASGRPRYHLLKKNKEISGSNYLISSNGSEIYDTENNKIIHQNYMDTKDIKYLYKKALKNNFRILLVIDDFEYVTKYTKSSHQKLIKNIDDIISNYKIKQCMIMDDDIKKFKKFRDKIKKDKRFHIVNESECYTNNKTCFPWISIGSFDASKGNAIKKLCEYLNVPIDNTIAIGNDFNDLSMFDTVNFSIAVDNAHGNVKNKVNKITKSNNEDGVAIALEEYFNKKIT